MSDKGSINNITLPVYKKLKSECSVVRTESGITELSDDVLNKLKVGDMIAKKTGNMKHNYIVTYKEEKHGICLSYYACGYLETVSYDYTDGHWVYNTTDVFNGDDIKGFDGDVKVTGGPKYYIDSSDIPSKTGLYRLVYKGNETILGFIQLQFISSSVFSIMGIYDNTLIKGTSSTGNNFYLPDNYYKPTVLYQHSVKFNASGSYIFTIISNDKTPGISNVLLGKLLKEGFAQHDNSFYWLINVGGGGAYTPSCEFILNREGVLKTGDNNPRSCFMVKHTPPSTYELYYGTIKTYYSTTLSDDVYTTLFNQDYSYNTLISATLTDTVTEL